MTGPNKEQGKKRWHLIEGILTIVFVAIFIIVPMSYGVLWGRDDSKSASTNKTFYGYNCVGDCSGHIAGFKWASDRGISDSENCRGNSQSFIEGCQAYVAGENNFGNGEY